MPSADGNGDAILSSSTSPRIHRGGSVVAVANRASRKRRSSQADINPAPSAAKRRISSKTTSLPAPTASHAHNDMTRIDTSKSHFVRTRAAEPYFLQLAKVRLSDMKFCWTRYTDSREIIPRQVDHLVEKFRHVGVQREDPVNFMKALVSREQLDAMMSHLGVDAEDPPPRHIILPFCDWSAVNGRPLDVIAGQHRAAAFKTYMSAKGGADVDFQEAWWICELYDADALPEQVLVELRSNADQCVNSVENHRDTWRNLRDLLSPINTSSAVAESMWERLTVASTGSDGISGLEAIFWLQWIDDVLHVLDLVSDEARTPFDPSADDWNRIRTATITGPVTPQGDPAGAVRALFHQDPVTGDPVPSKRVQFLTRYPTEDSLDRLRDLFASHTPLPLFDITARLAIRRSDAEVLATVMHHVSLWVAGNEPDPVRSENTKPPYRSALIPTLRRILHRGTQNPLSCPAPVTALCHRLGLDLARVREDFCSVCSRGMRLSSLSDTVPLNHFHALLRAHPSDPLTGLAEVLSIEVQNDVWRAVQPRLELWKSESHLRLSLHDTHSLGSAAYATRFAAHGPWSDVLGVVTRWLGREPFARPPVTMPITTAATSLPGLSTQPAATAWIDTVLAGDRRRVSLADHLPFISMPDLVSKGFEHLQNRNLQSTSKPAIAAHYMFAKELLNRSIRRREPFVDLLLVIALVFGSCSGTPYASPGKNAFEISVKGPTLGSVRAAALIVRALWFIKDTDFREAEENGSILRRQELFRQVGSPGLNHHTLVIIGLCDFDAKKAARDSMFDRQKIKSPQELEAMRKRLFSLFNHPESFFRELFRTSNCSQWLTSCSSIVVTTASP
ncbi:hypothetical protein COL154_013567 [Colletotrichum chrysophilum]|nr:hypothetical protein KNSL1_013127 [Colletotrichum chrysophilum]KAJ0349478.1 hypothetical protein COL154_013567 [Colletotrichum chrysophilum]